MVCDEVKLDVGSVGNRDGRNGMRLSGVECCDEEAKKDAAYSAVDAKDCCSCGSGSRDNGAAKEASKQGKGSDSRGWTVVKSNKRSKSNQGKLDELVLLISRFRSKLIGLYGATCQGNLHLASAFGSLPSFHFQKPFLLENGLSDSDSDSR
ncbi:hypothetical protein AKJ16_DCAP01124 [Drosera capensis]